VNTFSQPTVSKTYPFHKNAFHYVIIKAFIQSPRVNDILPDLMDRLLKKSGFQAFRLSGFPAFRLSGFQAFRLSAGFFHGGHFFRSAAVF
jgi:hypothetical protein